MLSFFRQHKNKLLLVLIVLLVLAAAYIFTEKPPTAPSPVKEPAFSAASAESTASTETAFPESSLHKPSTTSKPNRHRMKQAPVRHPYRLRNLLLSVRKVPYLSRNRLRCLYPNRLLNLPLSHRTFLPL